MVRIMLPRPPPKKTLHDATTEDRGSRTEGRGGRRVSFRQQKYMISCPRPAPGDKYKSWSTAQYGVAHCSTAQYKLDLCTTAQYGVAQCNTAQYKLALCSTARYRIAVCSTAQYKRVLFGTAQYKIALCSTAHYKRVLAGPHTTV